MTGTLLLLVKRCALFNWKGLLWTFSLQVPVTLPKIPGGYAVRVYYLYEPGRLGDGVSLERVRRDDARFVITRHPTFCPISFHIRVPCVAKAMR